MDVEILEFNIPSAKNTLLLLKNIETELKKDDLYLKLYEMFSAYGLLFQVSLTVVDQEQPGCLSYLAYIRFYSARACTLARTDVQRRPHRLNLSSVCGGGVKLGISRARDGVIPLLRFRCEELANYYIGFNGWNSKILYHRQEDADPLTIKYVTVVRLEFGGTDLCCEGAGLTEEIINLELELLNQRVNVARRSIGEAFVAAWGKVMFVVLNGSKVHIEINTIKRDAFMYNPLWDQPEIVVNEADYDEAEEEEEGGTEEEVKYEIDERIVNK